ncbi:MAG TPA: HDOD domain-containing protein [Deltaproteobacteria bacterium]|nr:HDOD domain-containing protein [Deltaproteobacteria bacterium]HOM29873.1 HDOD domain-containing protein [Deltaproteobacteria bacterium]HPP79850.1 HDOD domain-containing protein [Deltaproteobacteria bacterium]
MVEHVETPSQREKILAILERAPDILTLPGIIQQILEVTSRKNSSASDLTAIIESDPALTSRVIAVANSPYYGFVKKITNVSHAIVVLGFREIQNIALSMSVLKMFDPKGSEFVDQLWKHSFCVGVASRMIAEHLRLKVEGKYFVGGLLHDVGKIFFSQYVFTSFDRLLSVLWEEDTMESYHALEERMLGITHQEVARILLGEWMFPAEIVDAVACHHDPASSEVDRLFACCIHLADVICTAKGITPLKDRHFVLIDRGVLRFLEECGHTLTTSDVKSFMDRLDLEIERQSTYLSAFRNR